MKKYINYLKIILKNYIYLMIFIFIISIFSTLNIINYKVSSITGYIFILFLSFSLGYKCSKGANKKGYLVGTLIGLLNILIMFILSLILKTTLNPSIITYYITLLLVSIIGGMIGINHKTN